MFNAQNMYFQAPFQGPGAQGGQRILLNTPDGTFKSLPTVTMSSLGSSSIQDESTQHEAYMMLRRRLTEKEVMYMAEPTLPAHTSHTQFEPVRQFQALHDNDIQGTSNSLSVVLTPSVPDDNYQGFKVPLPGYDPEFRIDITIQGRIGKQLWSSRLHDGKSSAVNDIIKSTVDNQDEVLDERFKDGYVCTQAVPFATGNAEVNPWRTKRDPPTNYTLGHLLTRLSQKQHNQWRRMSEDAERPGGEHDKRLLKDLVGHNAGAMGEEVVHLNQVYIVAIRRRWVSRPAWQAWCYFPELEVRLG
ncbi:hypothetical protein C8Q79DRAFT_930572 [Trametes meyenii]|nr:hypothetical protein C8Q79DRAFT_930572 [Trametes meyenii]